MRRYIVVCVSILLASPILSSCSTPQKPITAGTYFAPSYLSSDNIEHVEAKTLDPTKAADQAARDFKDGTCKFYAVYGFARYYPAISETHLKRPHKTVMVEGTSDFGGEYNRQGNEYALAYNQAALKNCGTSE